MPITQTQRQVRRKYLGSSDTPVIMNLPDLPYKKTASDVYWSKVAELPDDDSSKPKTTGNRLEKDLIAWTGEELGVEIITDPEQLFHVSGDGLLAANHDALIVDRDEGIEAKYRNGENAKSFGEPYTDQVADDVIIQVQHQMYCSELSKVYVPVAVPSYWGIDYRLYIVQRDEDLIKTIVKFGHEWWEKHVKTKTPPNGDGVPPMYVLKALERRAGAQIRLPEEAVKWADRRTELKEQIKSLVKEVEAEDARLIHALGDAEVGLLPNSKRKVTYHQYESSRFDGKRFRLEHPEIAPDYMSKSFYRTLYIKKK